MSQKYPTSFKLNFFSINLIQIKFHCYFCKVYKVTVTKQLNFFYLITIYENYCNSKKVLCDDIKTYFQVYVCLFFLLPSWKRKSFLSYENEKNMGWCNKSWQPSIMTPVLFWENDNNLKVTLFALVTHYALGDLTSWVKTCEISSMKSWKLLSLFTSEDYCDAKQWKSKLETKYEIKCYCSNHNLYLDFLFIHRFFCWCCYSLMAFFLGNHLLKT